MINRLIIKNFRSIKELNIELKPFNAFIGPNSSGKSNILRALNLIVGSTYPSVRTFEDFDFYQHNKSSPIHIEVRFSESLNTNADVYGFRITFDGNDMAYVAINYDGEVARYHNGTEIRVSNLMREEVTGMYLPLDRQAYQQIKPSQWVVYGKLLKHIALQIDTSQKDQFKADVEHSFEQNIYDHVRDVENNLRDFVKEQTGLETALKLSIIDPTTILKDLRPRISDETGFEVDADAEGAGVQSAVAIAIARTYAQIVQQPLTLVIEEPELYLHPHGCRHFYKILQDLSNQGVQIIYATHERSFVNIGDFESICLIKKENGETKAYSGNEGVSEIDVIRTASKFNEELNEVFFAEKVILVEGPDDKIACRLALEKLGVGLDENNISIVDCGGNGGITPMVEILSQFNIKTFTVVDEDPENVTTGAIITGLKTLLGADKVFLQSPDLEGIFGQDRKFTKEKALKILPSWFDSNSVPQVYIDTKNALSE